MWQERLTRPPHLRLFYAVDVTTAPSTALLTDHYELTMLQTTLADGTAERRSVFELFARHLPEGRRYGVVAGIGRLLDSLENFRFGSDEIAFLRDNAVVNEQTLGWLEGFRFSGDIWGYPEGEIYFPGSPVLIVESSFAEGVILETLFLSILNHDSAIASAAARMISAAGERPCIEMGSRRTHERSAVACARAAYLAGFASTSNLQAGREYGIPTVGTSAHSFTLLHDSERDAFTAQISSLGKDTTLLVDTYDVTEAVQIAVELSDGELGAVRLDSGDLVQMARTVRDQLDSLGATDTRITVTSDLDEYAIQGLAVAPVDGYGVGTSLVTGSGHPTCGMVYKLVARAGADGELVSVAKKSKDKLSIGGRKYAVRKLSERMVAEAEVLGIGAPAVSDTNDRQLLVQFVEAGQRVHHESLDVGRARLQDGLNELPMQALQLSKGYPAIETTYEGE